MPARDTGRSRTNKALKRQRKIEERLDSSWKKYARCTICRRRYVVNNYSDRKVRVNQDKIAGKIVCIWCRCRDGKFIVQLMLLAEKMAAHEMSFCHSDPADRPRPDCKCTGCIAGRILKAHEEAPTLQ